VDGAGRGYLAYHIDNSSYGGLRFATDENGSWSWVNVDRETQTGQYTSSLALRGRDVHIVYLDRGAGVVRYAVGEATCPEQGDALDRNCDGADGTDADRDGHASLASGGDDCDDGDPARFAGAAELCDGKDNDCDGTADEECEPGGPEGQ